jgi:hypothetical protein
MNLYALNVSASNFMKHTLKDPKVHEDFNTVAVGDGNTPLSPTDMSSKQNINKEILELNHTIDQMDLDINRTFHSTSKQCTLFSAAHGTFSKIDHILGHKESLSKYKKIEIILCILSDHCALKLEINNKNSNKKHANDWKMNNTLFNDQWVTDEIKEEIKSFLEFSENENMTYGTKERQY